MSEIKLNTIEEALEDFRRGEFLIVVDDEDRENEGDFIIAAEKVTPEKVNFMMRYGRGVLCAPITEDRARELELEMQVPNNTSVHETPFTITVDRLGNGCTTGVSMYDRAQTILALADPNITPGDLARPGHVCPLRARNKGVLRRAGHTEAAVDLARLAGLQPVAALIEIINEDGTMARLPQLWEGAQRNGFDYSSDPEPVDKLKKRRVQVTDSDGSSIEFLHFDNDVISVSISSGCRPAEKPNYRNGYFRVPTVQELLPDVTLVEAFGEDGSENTTIFRQAKPGGGQSGS